LTACHYFVDGSYYDYTLLQRNNTGGYYTATPENIYAKE